MEILPDKEKQSERREAVEEAEQGSNVIVSANLLLQLDEPARAETLVLARHGELQESFYDSLISLAKGFEKADRLPAATACYRALLLDILNSGRSKAYGHAARYFKKLEAMAGKNAHCEPMVPHDEFVAGLKQGHGLKRSFWSRVEK